MNTRMTWWGRIFSVLAVLGTGCTTSNNSELTGGESDVADKNTQKTKTVITVPLETDSCWQDFSYLAAVPAGAKVNNGQPVVVAVDQYGTIRPELQDFLRRYKPTDIYLIDALSNRGPTTDGLIAHWPFTDGNGHMMKAAVGSSDAELKRAPVWKGLKETAYQFDGRTIEVSNGSIPGSGQELTVAFWMKPDALAHQHIISKRTDQPKAPGWIVMLRKDDDLPSIRFRVGGGGAAWHHSDVTAKKAYAPGKWVHVTCTFADGTSKIYLNGGPKATRENITYSTPNNMDAPLKFGSDHNEGFTGALDEVRIYNRALNDVEIQQLPSTIGTTKKNLVGYWPLDSFEKGETPDVIGGNNLTAVGKPTSEKGRRGNAVHLMGKGHFLKLGIDADALLPFTLLFDLHVDKEQTCCVFRKNGSTDQTSPWSVHVDGKDLIFQLGGDVSSRLVAKGVIVPNTPISAAVVVENGSAAVYVNKELAIEAKVKTDGKDLERVGTEFSGEIDNVQIFSKALTLEELNDLSPSKETLIAKWSVDKQIADSSATPSWNSAQNGAGLQINGINEYVACESLPKGTSELTVSCWIKPETDGWVFSRFPYDSADGPGWGLFLDKEQRRATFIVGSRFERKKQMSVTISEAYSVGKWVHLACTFKDKRATVYIDGQRALYTEGKAVDLNQVDSRLLIGCEQSGKNLLKGTVADVRIYDRSLDDESILSVYGNSTKHAAKLTTKKLSADSAAAAACTLATTFWKSSDTVVCCSDSSYGDALVASGLAGRLQVPLLFVGKSGLSAETKTTITTLGVKRIITVGSVKLPKLNGVTSTSLKDSTAVIKWMKENNIAIDYFAAANPLDRTFGMVRKTSLAAPLLAAGRDGVVVPLDFETDWKLPFKAEKKVESLSNGLPKKAEGRPMGEFKVNGVTRSFVITTAKNKNQLRVYITDEDGKYTGPFNTADTITLGDRTYTICLDPKSAYGEADLRLTWPGSAEIQNAVKGYCADLGGHPTYLCIVGRPDVIPHGIVRRRSLGNEGLVSDLMFADVDDDPFIEMAHARFVGEDVYSATLTAARGLVYDDLIDPSWATRYGAASWSIIKGYNLQDAGYTPVPHHSGEDGLLDEDSQLREAAAIFHTAHSGWLGLGGFVSYHSRVLLAPSVIESGGCTTMSLERDEQARSTPVRLLRNGAICVAGNIRLGIGQQMLYRSEFWNGLMQGQTTGQAHKHALNRAMLSFTEKQQYTDGSDRYQYYIRAVFGDPAVKIHVPQETTVAAKTEIRDLEVIVKGPAQWDSTPKVPLLEWNCKFDKLYVIHGAGVGKEQWWFNKERRNDNSFYYAVEVRTDKAVTGVEQIDDVPEPLGWTKKFWIDEHQDGTRSIFWRVKPIDVDIVSGEFKAEVKEIRYRLLTEADTTRGK